MYRNAQLRYTQIVYCTLWEECKQTQCPHCSHRSWRERTKALMWYYSPTKNKLIYQVRANINDFWLSGQYGKYKQYILISPLESFSLKNDALPLNSLSWSPPTAVHRFDACYMSVPGLYISWHTQTKQPVILQYPGECWECWFQSDYTIVQKNTAMPICFTMCM